MQSWCFGVCVIAVCEERRLLQSVRGQGMWFSDTVGVCQTRAGRCTCTRGGADGSVGTRVVYMLCLLQEWKEERVFLLLLFAKFVVETLNRM